MNNVLKCFILFFVFSMNAFSQSITDDEKDILILQDTRSLGENNKLLNYLNSKEENTVIKTLYAIANIADENTVDKTGELLTNLNPKIRSAAAFALGQIPCISSINYLSQALGNEKDPAALISILNALGKTGSETELGQVVNLNSDENKILSAKAISIARFAIRKIRNENSVSFLKILASTSRDAEVLKGTAYALWRTADKDLLQPARNEILNMLNSTEPEIRMWAVNALSRLVDVNDINLLLENIKTESDWRVKINILNSLVLYKTISDDFLDNKLISTIDILLIDQNPNVKLTALNILGSLFSDQKDKNKNTGDVKTILEKYFTPDNDFDWQEVGEAVNSYGMIFKDDGKETLFRFLYESDDYDVKPFIVRAFGYFNDAMVYREVRDSISSEVKRYGTKFNVDNTKLIGSKDLLRLYRAFVEMITMLDDKLDAENLNIARLIYSEFTGSKDPMLVSLCLNALKDSLYLDYREETNAIISFDFGELNENSDFDVMLLFIDSFGEMKSVNIVDVLEKKLSSDKYEIASASAKALEKITGKTYKTTAKVYTDFDWDMLQKIYQNRYITIYTEAGDMKLELYPEIAPFTCINFVKLAQKNFFRGSIFHRVVPNFVIQGGDPTNSGEGGPGYSIRSEFSDFSFVRGVLGMASSGKDTEGSQFFIMHSPHYHLDGKYTSFGIVKEGFDVIDNVIYGTTVEKIQF
ncbi:MAG TPA: peptidylprolyl isomerase [Ignavibacteria bacterium]